MSSFLFDEFSTVSASAWKQKIQMDLKGADYNKTLLWNTEEGITVKPFYTSEDSKNHVVDLPKKGFNICQSIFVDDVKIANNLALDALKRGASSIQFTATNTFDFKTLFENINTKTTTLYFQFHFLNSDFIIQLSQFINSKNAFYYTDIIGNLAKTGNWFSNLKTDHQSLEKIVKEVPNSIGIDASLYQNAGASIVQQLAYTLAHANEYLNHFGNESVNQIHVKFSVGSNYFFEIAKLRAFRILWKTLAKEYFSETKNIHILVKPSTRNKTLYDYNVNMLRTTSECMSAILGGADAISNISYDSIYHKSNEFGERISRNQLLILQQESYLKEAQSFANGAYYIDSITNQLAEKALEVFKLIEKGGGFLKQLKEGIIQNKITENANKEQILFDNNKIVLLGTNLQTNKEDKMQHHLELYPFLKQNNSKTLLSPILKKRLSEPSEKERLESEKK
jgi:methylmalonyl-CoA mutase